MSTLPTAEQAVIDQIKARAEKGLSKYGVTTNRKDLSLSDWVQHAQEEAMDLAVYLEKVKQNAKQENEQDIMYSNIYKETAELLANLAHCTQNAQNGRQELLKLREVCGRQAEQIKALHGQLEALDRLFTLAIKDFKYDWRDYLQSKRDAIVEQIKYK